jgi:hypothetical protein
MSLNLKHIRHINGPRLDVAEDLEQWNILSDLHPRGLLRMPFEHFEEIMEDADFIFGAPPCHTFSNSGMWAHWDGFKPKTQEAIDSREMAFTMAHYLMRLSNKKVWVMENPQGKLKPNLEKFYPEFPEGIRTTYCVYGSFRQKPTYFWPSPNFPLVLRDPCPKGGECHMITPSGSQEGTRLLDKTERAGLPVELQYSLLNQAENILRLQNHWQKWGGGPKE